MRATNAPASRERRRRRLELAKGFYGARSKLFRTATEAVDRAMRLATAHRKLKKRNRKNNLCGRTVLGSLKVTKTYARAIQGR